MESYKINKRISFVLAFVILFSSIFIFPTNVEAAEGMTTVAELQDAVKNAADGDVITLSKDFTFGNATLTVPNVNVTVDGGDKVWSSGTITTNGSGTGSLTIKNLKYGEALETSAFKINDSGKVILDNILVEKRTKGSGGGIELASSAKLTIRNSTFRNNVATAHGYSGGVLYATGFNGEFLVENSIFEGNETTMGGSVYGGEGGAIAFNRLGSKANLTFRNSYFKGNKAAVELGGKLADGGAIGIFNTVNGAKITIDGNTFEGNIAGDDGGAVFIQSNDVINTGVVFRNNTFYKNEALSKSFSQTYSGGAIQLYGNGGPFQGRLSDFDFENNTFIGNKANAEGGAIGFTGYVTNAVGGNLSNNLFVGNTGTDEETNNIGALDDRIVNNKGGNVGIDNGTATDVTVENTLGTAGIAYGPNGSTIEAGHMDSRITIPTVVIMPEGKADSVAETAINPDQRGINRGATPFDSGSTEISWLKYNANGGTFTLPELTYTGTEYYEGTTPTDYYAVGNANGTTTIVDGYGTLKATNNGKIFLGWSTDKDATEPDSTYAIGEVYTLEDEGLILYAVWKDAEFRVEYNGNGNTSGAVPVDSNSPYVKGSVVTVLDRADLVKDGYKFIGWNTNKDSTDALYKVGDTFEITEDVVLYAIWEKLDDKVEEDEKPTDYSSIIWDWGHTTIPEVKTELHRAYINGYPDGTIQPQGEITRGEVAAIISRLHAELEEIEYTTETKYSDVKATDWYAKHIAYVSDKGLMEGYEDGSFKPEEKITRAEYATVVARFKNLERIATTFEDSSDHWASEYIGAVANKKWITGYPDGSFKPANNISREEVATMTNKMLDRNVDEQGVNNLNIKKFTDLEYGTWSYYELVEASNTHEYVRRDSNTLVENWKEIIEK